MLTLDSAYLFVCKVAHHLINFLKSPILLSHLPYLLFFFLAFSLTIVHFHYYLTPHTHFHQFTLHESNDLINLFRHFIGLAIYYSLQFFIYFLCRIYSGTQFLSVTILLQCATRNRLFFRPTEFYSYTEITISLLIARVYGSLALAIVCSSSINAFFCRFVSICGDLLRSGLASSQ